ncbi:MAG: DUF4388 domain-containing protein [Lentisphaeria bacterium]|nr:DUF4388 domain-containing protein [Lentisphaeria bacterium]
MADNARLIITGETPVEFASLREVLGKAGLTVEAKPDVAAVVAEFKEAPPPRRLLVAHAEGDSFTRALSEAISLKERYPSLPVVLYAEKVREVSRLRCLEQGLDECVTRDQFVSTVTALARLLPPASPKLSSSGVESKSTSQMYFQLNGDELSNALQFLCMTSRDGRLKLKFESGGSGSVFIGGGTVIHAEFGDDEGIPAIARMLRSGAMEARFFDGSKAPKVTNTAPISGVLIEASVMADESDI